MPKTKRVRIAVAIDEQGGWRAQGCGGHTDEQTADAVLTRGATLCWIEAEIPIPKTVTVEGNVTPTEETD